MRVTAAQLARLGKIQALIHLNGLSQRFIARHKVVDNGALDYLITDPDRGIEGRGGALRDIGCLAAAQLPALLMRKFEKIASI